MHGRALELVPELEVVGAPPSDSAGGVGERRQAMFQTLIMMLTTVAVDEIAVMAVMDLNPVLSRTASA